MRYVLERSFYCNDQCFIHFDEILVQVNAFQLENIACSRVSKLSRSYLEIAPLLVAFVIQPFIAFLNKANQAYEKPM